MSSAEHGTKEVPLFSPFKRDRVMAVLQQTARCIFVFEMLSHSTTKKKKKKRLSQDDPILGFYDPLTSSLQELWCIILAHDDWFRR